LDLAFYFEKINASPLDALLELFGTLTDLHIGNIKIGEINWKHSFGEIGILIGERDFQLRGYATGALQQTIGLAFEEL
jgi:RimJ/RimL family protein N-acetyltransferase